VPLRAADDAFPPELARAVRDFLARYAALARTTDPGERAAAFDLLERVEAIPTAALTGEALVDRELLLARLEVIFARGTFAVAGRPSQLRRGAPPAPGSPEAHDLERRIDRLAGSVPDLLPDEVAAARSDLAAERTLAPFLAKPLERLEAALAASRGGPSRETRDYLRLLRVQSSYAGSLEDLVALAEDEVRRTGEAMERIAADCGAPSTAALLEQMKEEGAHEDTIAVAREEVARSAAFARDRGLVTVPAAIVASLVVESGPASSRTPFGHYIPVGWQDLLGHYVVTETSGDDAGSRSRRREQNRLWLRGIAAHEGIPGHHLHFALAARSKDRLLTLDYQGATTEGWGLFVEGMLARAGYFDSPREARLTPLRGRRWRALRVILDAGLQTGKLTREQAIARLERDAFFERGIATEEVDRYRARAGYYAGYLLGARRFEALERRALERGGDGAARALRDRILAVGPAAPLRAVLELARDERVLPPRE
jgi:uncharacterized protein (DUF885 family)